MTTLETYFDYEKLKKKIGEPIEIRISPKGYGKTYHDKKKTKIKLDNKKDEVEIEVIRRFFIK